MDGQGRLLGHPEEGEGAKRVTAFVRTKTEFVPLVFKVGQIFSALNLA